MLKKKLRNQKGFTLIEIIAVLVILGILAAVAIPKFLDLQDQANQKALEGALAEGMSTASMQYGRLALSLGAAPTAAQVQVAAAARPPASTDFGYTFTAVGTTGVNVLVNWNPTKTGINAVSKLWTLP